MNQYQRNCTELEEHACKWWPEHLVTLAGDANSLPVLIQTQDKFLSILNLADACRPESLFELIQTSHFAANLFLKHLMVLSDFGSEPIQRINKDFLSYFPERVLLYSVSGIQFSYKFIELPVKGILNNKKMNTDSLGMAKSCPITSLYADLITLLLFGSNAVDSTTSHIFSRCTVGSLLGNSNELKRFIKQRYIFVSRITGGTQANNLGNCAQVYVEKYLRSKLSHEYSIHNNGHIPNITHNSRTETTFDLVVEHKGKYVAIEISFQVTTNSVIERKAGQAQARYEAIENSGNYIAYIIDGAGNFQRKSALKTICQYSHCTVAYSDDEFSLLVNFILEKI